VRHAAFTLSLLIGLMALAQARADVPQSTRVEIDYLLATVANSGCTFFRNGDWYDAKQAEKHLRLKYDALSARNLIGSAEDFIDRGGTYSSISGKPYAIRCPGSAPVPSAQWLRELLAQYRRSPH
jgi:hypothetical protein